MVQSPEQPLEIWLVDIDCGSDAIDALGTELPLVPAGEIDLQRNTVLEQQKRRARVALRVLLAGYVGLERASAPFAIAQGGKPALAAPSAPMGGEILQFSLAHSGSVALIGLSRQGAIGVDVEPEREVRINGDRRALLERAAAELSPRQPLPDGPPDRRFVQAWVRLEALAKATGEGVGALLGRLRDAPARGEPTLAENPAGGPPLVVRDLDWRGLPRLHAAVAACPTALDPAATAPAVATMPTETTWMRDWIAGAGRRHQQR